MGCNSCKNKKQMSNEEINEVSSPLSKDGFGDSLYMRLIIFTLSLVILLVLLVPVVVPFMIIMLFNRIVLRKGTSVTKPLVSLGKMLRTSSKRKNKGKKDKGDDLGDINPDDYETVNVEDIK